MGPHRRAVDGGIARLEALVAEHSRPLAADLWHHYHGLDLRDLWRPGGGQSRLTWRLLGVLIDGLDEESLTLTAIRDSLTPEQVAKLKAAPQQAGQRMSRLERIVAAVHDQVAAMRAEAPAIAAGTTPQYPSPWPRPGDDTAAEAGGVPGLTDGEMAWLESATAQHNQDDNSGGELTLPE